jgi:hypothetical protein
MQSLRPVVRRCRPAVTFETQCTRSRRVPEGPEGRSGAMNYQAFNNGSLTMMYEAVRGLCAENLVRHRRGSGCPRLGRHLRLRRLAWRNAQRRCEAIRLRPSDG